MNNSPEYTIDKLKSVADKAIQSKKYSLALAATGACGEILYQWNQTYTDDQLEEYILQISGENVKAGFGPENTDKNTILFYDAFGMDTRGLVIIYLRALTRLGYKVIYVTVERARGRQPVLEKAWVPGQVTRRYISGIRPLNRMLSIHAVFEEFHPANAFFYSVPGDAEGAAAFAAYAGIVTRFQINLTDHAFWLGLCAMDYCLEFRDYGATVSVKYRGVSRDKIIALPYYPYIDRDISFQGLPEIAEGKKVLFSGGSLYKTLGDSNNSYYKIVETILSKHDDVVFIYAGYGDDSELRKTEEKYPGRVAHISERNDLYELMRHSTVYLNTYPMVGGLMMQYAVVAGLVPLTLSDDDLPEQELLFHQKELNIEFDSIDSIVAEADKLLEDTAYREKRGQLLQSAIISERGFESNLDELIRSHRNDITIKINDELDTIPFRKTYITRYNNNKACLTACARRSRMGLVWKIPQVYIKGLPYIFKRVLKKL